jgi:hypothetical protein
MALAGGLLAGSMSNGFGSPAVSMHILISGDSRRVVCTAGNVERGGSQIRVALLQTRHSDESSYSSPAAVDCRPPQHRHASKTVIGVTAIPYPLLYTTVRIVKFTARKRALALSVARRLRTVP